MQKLYCPKCNNNQNFYRYGKDSDGYQKYQCRACFNLTDQRAASGKLVGCTSDLIYYVRSVEWLVLSTMTMNTTLTIAVGISVVIILSLRLKQMPLHRRQCPPCLARLILNICYTGFSNSYCLVV